MTDEASSQSSDVVFTRRGALGHIHLNRPRALNALSLAMAKSMLSQLAEWSDDPDIQTIAITGEGRAFCAGGDIRAIYERGMAGDPFDEFFAAEYGLNVALHDYAKPIVTFVDGIAMGGGVGIGYHVDHVVLGENARFAMPECSIGFFPDVGASHLLGSLPPGHGEFVALTGVRLGPGDQLALGIADAFVPSERWNDVLERLANGGSAPDVISSAERPKPEPDRDWSKVAAQWDGADPVALIAPDGAWGDETAKADPISLRVALEQFKRTKDMSFRECMRLDARIAHRMMRGTSFYEGIRAAVIDKDQSPDWKHGSPIEVPDREVDAYFTPVMDGPLATLGGVGD